MMTTFKEYTYLLPTNQTFRTHRLCNIVVGPSGRSVFLTTYKNVTGRWRPTVMADLFKSPFRNHGFGFYSVQAPSSRPTMVPDHRHKD